MIDALISDPTVRILEQTVSFTEQRHNVLLEDIANVSTLGLSAAICRVPAFQKSLKQAVAEKWASRKQTFEPESDGGCAI